MICSDDDDEDHLMIEPKIVKADICQLGLVQKQESIQFWLLIGA